MATGRPLEPASRPAVEARRRRRVSPLVTRILAANLIALAIFVGGVLYLGDYGRGLLDAKAAALRTQGEIIAGALGETVVIASLGEAPSIDTEAARQMVRRLVAPIKTRARLFDANGALVADSWRLISVGGIVESEELAPPTGASVSDAAGDLLCSTDWWVFGWVQVEPATTGTADQAGDYREAMDALAGNFSSALRDGEPAGLILSVAVPVQHFKQVQGALMLSTTLGDVVASVAEVRARILRLSLLAFAVTGTVSVFLAGTIARPVRRLAGAADAVRHRIDRAVTIPDFSSRGDEIGDLSRALSDMTQTLWSRMDAIENFAADVSHEIKNPLSSLRSAVETAARVKDPEQQKKLMTIILEDVKRLDRLISDISGASRLDSELSRAETAPVNIDGMLLALVEICRTTGIQSANSLVLDVPEGEKLVVEGVESRLVQVFQNLVDNARSFSPPGGIVRLSARRNGDWVEVAVEDDGPGLPSGKLGAVFDRFYSARPAGEKFGTHSGLGLSISKQIVEAHGGTITAHNRGSEVDKPLGARFIVRLPA